jgi:hypothetical protein
MLKHNFTAVGQINRIKGALISGTPAAYMGIFLISIGPFSRLFDRLLYRILSRNEIKEDKLPHCLMIISPPRSGSTITYQVLVRVIPSVYISNLHYMFPNCASSYMLNKNMFGSQISGFRNYYGYTSSIYDVNEGNIIVEAFFHDKANREQIRKRFTKFVVAMRATPDRPLILKNIRAYNHIALLSSAVSEVVFLRIRRNPEQVIQSTLRAYNELGTFNPVPNNLKNTRINDPVEFAVKQYLEIEREIDLQMEQINQSAKLEWRYEDFCSETWPMIEDLAQNYLKMDPGLLNRNAAPSLKVSNRVKVNNHEARRISILLEGMTTRRKSNSLS